MINIHHHTMIHIIGMEIIQIHMIFMVQHSSHTLLQQNGFTQQVYLKYEQECLDDQLYGLEKFWVFLKYSRQKPKINSKLKEILKNYKNLEDFRVDDASFPQQFFPTKSNYNCSSIRSNSNSLKPNGEQYLNGAKLYTRFVFLLFCLK
ncbi:unnamed protein product [Rotaria sordida]|uniref:Uncharacterized protein n=1 Tax=Rotaria sordida TaxID=392033 RepID=A0A815CMG3_9BILA|nr:unnamed protein product [Rotaria sordida]